MGIYDTEGNLTLYHYPECIDEYGELVEGGSLVVLDITVTSQDAVNFVTNKTTGVQARRYADNPFLFRADEIAYLVDITEDATNGYTYYDAVFFNQMGYFQEHEMAYEVLPGESVSFFRLTELTVAVCALYSAHFSKAFACSRPSNLNLLCSSTTSPLVSSLLAIE